MVRVTETTAHTNSVRFP